jgi:hypothetical protein
VREPVEVLRLRKRTQLQIDIVQRLAAGQLMMKDAQTMLSCSERTLWRLLKRQKTDTLFFLHKNSGRKLQPYCP